MHNVGNSGFILLENLEADEVAEYLATIMDQELNTLVDDDSDLAVSMMTSTHHMISIALGSPICLFCATLIHISCFEFFLQIQFWYFFYV